MKFIIFPLNNKGLRTLGVFIYDYFQVGLTYHITVLDFDHKVVGDPILFKLENKRISIITIIKSLYEDIIRRVENNDCNLKTYSSNYNGYKEYYRVVYLVVKF